MSTNRLHHLLGSLAPLHENASSAPNMLPDAILGPETFAKAREKMIATLNTVRELLHDQGQRP